MILVFKISFFIIFLFDMNFLIASKRHVDPVIRSESKVESSSRSFDQSSTSTNISSAQKASMSFGGDVSSHLGAGQVTANKPFSISQLIFRNPGIKASKNPLIQLKEPQYQDPGIHLDPTKIVVSHQEQQPADGVALKYNQKMTEPLPNYIQKLSTTYTNVAAVVPEIFTTYAIRFLDPNKAWTRAAYSPDQLVVYGNGLFTTYTWTLPSLENASLPNLYKGINFLNNLYGRADFRFNDQIIQKYLPTLQAQFPHVPDKILATYISVAKPSGSIKNFEQLIELQIKKCNANNFDFNKLDNLSNRKFDLDRLYLTMQAVESIHSHKDYVQFLKRPTQAMTVEQAIITPGAPSLLLGAERTAGTIDRQQKIADAYLFTQDTNPEQLQTAWIMLNQDILALGKKIENLPENQSTQKTQLISLQSDAIAVSDTMDKLIVQKKSQEILAPLLPSAGVDLFEIIDKIADLKELAKKEQTQPASEVITKYNQQIDQIYQNVASTLVSIHEQLDELPKNLDEHGKPIDLLMKSFMSSDFEQALLKFQESLKSADRALKNSSPNKKPEYEKILSEKIEVVHQLNLMLERLQNIEDHAEKQTEATILFLKKDPRTNNTDLETHKAAVAAIFEQLKGKIKISPNKLKTLNEALSKYKKEFDQDVIASEDNNLSAQLAELASLFRWEDLHDQSLIEYKASVEALQYLIFDYGKNVEITSKQKILNTKVQEYIKNLIKHTLAQNSTIESRITIMEKKITALKEEDKKHTLFNNKTKEVTELNKLLVIENKTYQKKVDGYEEKDLTIFKAKDFQSRADLIVLYEDIVKQLKEESALHKAAEQIKSVQENFYQGNYGDAIKNLAYAGGNQTVAAKDLARTIFGPVWDTLPQALQYTIIIGLISLSAELAAIEANPYLTQDEKMELRDKAIKAIFTDFYNIIFAHTTGASVNTVATGNNQAIATEAGFNKIIGLLSPNDPNSLSYDNSMNSPNYVSNFDKFKAQYAEELSYRTSTTPTITLNYN